MGGFGALRLRTGFSRRLDRRCPRRHRSLRFRIRQRLAERGLRPAQRQRALPHSRRSRRRRGSWIQTRLSLLSLSASVAAILAAVRLLQRSSKLIPRVLTELFLERRRG